MAGRSVLQKVVSGMSTSGVIGARGGASAGAAAAATRNFDCSHVAARHSSLTSRIPSVIINRVKQAKRTFSSTELPTTEHEFAVRAKEREQEFAEWKAKMEAEFAQMAARDAESKRFWRNMKWLYGFGGFNILLGFSLDDQVKHRRGVQSRRKEWPTISSGWWD